MQGTGRTRGRTRGTGVRWYLWRQRHASRGQALVELALVTPVLLVILLGAVDLGRIFYARIAVTNAAREGALVASREPGSWQAGAPCSSTNRVMCAATRGSAGSWVTVAPADVSLTCSPSCATAPGTTVAVRVSGRFGLLTPLMAIFTGGMNVAFSDTATANVVVVPATANVPTPAPSAAATASPSAAPSPAPTASATASAHPSATPAASASPTPSPSPTCAPPLVSFTSRAYTGQDLEGDTHSPASVVFTSTSTPVTGHCAITYWRWAFGDGQTDAGNLPSVVHDYGRGNQSLSFTVTLTVATPEGTFSYTGTVHA